MKCVFAIISKEGCMGCEIFEKKEHANLVEKLRDTVKIVKFNIKKDSGKIPDTIADYALYSPAFILLNPRSYYSYYDEDGSVKPNAKPGYKIKGLLYGGMELDEDESLETGTKYGIYNLPNTADSISCWVHFNTGNVLDLM